MNLGDIVRVTSREYPDTAREGVVVDMDVVDPELWVTVTNFWNKDNTYSTQHFDIEVIRRVEPKTIGTIHKDKNIHIWTRYSNMPTIIKPWVNEYGVVADWSELT